MTFDPRTVIQAHITTERTTRLRESNDEYVFRVDSKANKYMIKQAVEKAFNVKVVTVRTSVSPGKVRRMGKFAGKTPSWKKAFVRLKKDQSISMFDNA